ncbi:MAG: hypothetical protein ACE5JS_20180 [Nitrospinota bacterium]
MVSVDDFRTVPVSQHLDMESPALLAEQNSLRRLGSDQNRLHGGRPVCQGPLDFDKLETLMQRGREPVHDRLGEIWLKLEALKR